MNIWDTGNVGHPWFSKMLHILSYQYRGCLNCQAVDMVTLVDSSQFLVGSYGFQSYGNRKCLGFPHVPFLMPVHLSISHLCTNSGVYPRVRSLFLMGSISMDSNLMLSLYVYIYMHYIHIWYPVPDIQYPISTVIMLILIISNIQQYPVSIHVHIKHEVRNVSFGPEACRLSYDFGSPAWEADIDSMGLYSW